MAAPVIVQVGCAWDPNTPTSACCSSPAASALHGRLALPTPLLLWGQVWIELGKMDTPLFQLCEPGSEAGTLWALQVALGHIIPRAGTLSGQNVLSAVVLAARTGGVGRHWLRKGR